MSSFSITEPSSGQKWIAGILVVTYALVTLMPLLWIISTGFKTSEDSIAYPPKVFSEPSLEGYVNLFTTQTLQSPDLLEANPPTSWYEEIVHDKGMIIVGPSRFGERFMNSVIIGFGATFLSVFLGTLAAYAFSRYRVPLKDGLLFFILSTRMMPPIAVAIPIFLMYRNLGLSDTHLGMILLYTAVNISLAVWLLKGFIDEIPREYEEAALIDGYTRFQAFYKVVLPQALRVVLPPLGNQYLNLTKNTSLAIAVGYSDLVQVGQTVFNQTGKTLEVFSIWMGFYLACSLTISVVVNFFNVRLKIVER